MDRPSSVFTNGQHWRKKMEAKYTPSHKNNDPQCCFQCIAITLTSKQTHQLSHRFDLFLRTVFNISIVDRCIRSCHPLFYRTLCILRTPLFTHRVRHFLPEFVGNFQIYCQSLPIFVRLTVASVSLFKRQIVYTKAQPITRLLVFPAVIHWT